MKKLRTSFSAILVLAAAFSFVAPQSAQACSCMMSTTQEQADRASAIFVGEVTDVTTANPDGFGSKEVQFTVDRSWKGVDSSHVEVVTAQDSAACGIDFVEGERYLVFASASEEGGSTLSTGLCSGTTTEATAAEAITTLGPAEEAPVTAPEPEPEPEQESSGKGVMPVLLVIILVAALGGAAWNSRKPKA